jgi:hypothetical protein
MAKLVDNAVLDGALNVIKNNATQISVCATQPTNYTEAISTNMLALKSDVTGTDFTVGDGDTNGRKVAVAQFASISVTNSGTADHIALCGAASVLYYVTTCTGQALTAGNTVTIPTWDVELADPS